MQAYSTSIDIGGTLQAQEIEAFLSACAGSSVGLDWNIGQLTTDAASRQDLEEALHEAAAEKRPISLFNDSATNGHLDELETFCRIHGLTYVRKHDPDAGETGMTAWWTTGMDSPGESEADADGEPFVHARTIARALDAAGDNAACVAAIQAILATSIPVTVPAIVIAG